MSVKLRRATSRRKWRNRFYRIEKAAAMRLVTTEFLGPNNEREALARHMALQSLEDWLKTHAIGEVGERQVDSAPYADPRSFTASLFRSDSVLFRASVMAKRQYWGKARK